MIARKIWPRRNEFVFKGSFLHPSLVVQQSRPLLVDFKEVQSKNIRQITNNSSQVTTRNQAFPSDFKIVAKKKIATNRGYFRRFSSRRLIFVEKLRNHGVKMYNSLLRRHLYLLRRFLSSQQCIINCSGIKFPSIKENRRNIYYLRRTLSL